VFVLQRLATVQVYVNAALPVWLFRLLKPDFEVLDFFQRQTRSVFFWLFYQIGWFGSGKTLACVV